MSEGLIYKQIPKIMEEVGAIEKNRKNAQQGYQFRGVDEVYAALQLVMAKHGVFVVPEVLPDYEWTERKSSSGGALFCVHSRIKHTFYAEDGSSFEAVTFGEAMDSGDKAANKAMSVAIKYALIEVFCIPTSDPKDPENDNPKPLPAEPPPSASKRRYAPASEQEVKEFAEGGRVIFDKQMDVYKAELGPAYHEWLTLFDVDSKSEVLDPNHAREIYKAMKRAVEKKRDAPQRT